MTRPARSAAGFAPAPDVPILWLTETPSTNAEARRRAEAGEAGPLWIAARRQTAGRGRRGRAWETGTGNLAATLLTVVDVPPAEAAQVAFVAALAVYDLAVLQVPQALVRVKWPNDVLVDGAKVAGVLIESGKRDDGGLWLAVGVGVNLASPPAATEQAATCLKAHLRGDVTAPLAPEAALTTLSRAFDHWLALWTLDGFTVVRDAWTDRADLGRRCIVRLDRESVEGVAEALETDGALRLRLDDGYVSSVYAGYVFYEGGEAWSPSPSTGEGRGPRVADPWEG